MRVMDLVSHEPIADALDRESLLREFATGVVWKGICVPALQARLHDLQRRIARARTLPIEHLRWLQAEYAVLDELLDDPIQFFGIERGEGA